jgi:hypothetical protein
MIAAPTGAYITALTAVTHTPYTALNGKRITAINALHRLLHQNVYKNAIYSRICNTALSRTDIAELIITHITTLTRIYFCTNWKIN